MFNGIFLISSLLFMSSSSSYEFSFNDYIENINIGLEENGLSLFPTSDIEYIQSLENDLNKNLYLVDFSYDNGYIVFDDDGTIEKYSIYGDITSRIVDNVYFWENHLCNENGDYLDLFFDSNYYVGNSIAQQHANPIEYYEVNNYLTSKYGISFSMTDSGKLFGLGPCSSMGLKQLDCSVFVKHENGFIYSEGNCGLVSTANALCYYSRYQNYNGLPTWNETYSFYPQQNYLWANSAADYGYVIKDNYTTINKIYFMTRAFANSEGYIVSGMNESMTRATYENVTDYYGYNGQYINISGNVISKVKQAINNNIPLQLNVHDDVCYGGHGTMVTGYRVYEGRMRIGLFNMNISLVMASIFDGWSSTERWYDLTEYSSVPSDYKRASAQNFVKYTL